MTPTKLPACRSTFTLVVLLAACLGNPGDATAQSDRGTITGTDPASAVIPNVAIVAINTETGAKFETASTATGNYTLVQLPAGIYDLEAASPGFAKLVQKGIRFRLPVPIASTSGCK